MANSHLKGKYYKVDDRVIKELSHNLDGYHGYEDNGGYARAKDLVRKQKISYEQLKRVKNYFDKYEGDGKDDEYILNGGKIMELWVNSMLKQLRYPIQSKKKNMKDVGMQNQYNNGHKATGPAKAPKIDMMDLGLEEFKNINTIITEMIKQKQSWLTED